MKVRFSATARQELIEIGDYIAAESRSAARRYVARLKVRCEALTRFPQRYPVVPQIGAGVRCGVFRSHDIHYCVDIDVGTVLIERIVHSNARPLKYDAAEPMMSHKVLFSRALGLDPERLHFAAHSHHLWPDASYEAQVRAWDEANRYADRKWDLVFGEVVPEAQAHIASELGLPDPETVVFASNTHDFVVRIVSGWEARPVRILTSDCEFHAFRRQAERWEEAGEAVVTRVALEPFDSFDARFVAAAQAGGHDLIFISQVFFRTGQVFGGVADLAELAKPEGPWVVVDGYHGFMATPTDLSAVADRIFYVAGGYKYAMSGEGACFLHAPPGFCPRPVVTGWFAEFGNLTGPPGGVQYREDGGRFWGSTFDFTALYRFNGVRRMLDQAGLSTADVSAHALRLQTRFSQALAAGECGRLDQATVVNPVTDDESRARFIALKHPDAQAWRAELLAANVVTDVRDDTIRFGFGLYQDDEDVERLIALCHRLF